MKIRPYVTSLFRQPLALQAEAFAEILGLVDLEMSGGDVKAYAEATNAARQYSIASISHAAGPGASTLPGGAFLVNDVAIVPITGVMVPRTSMLGRFLGFLGMDELGYAMDTLADDRKVKAIVLAIDSPGGTVAGTMELSDKVRSAAARKPVTSMVDSLAASAAYWVASQANEIVVTPGGRVGSIGVIAGHVDFTEADRQAGIKVTLLTSSPYKAELSPYVVLTPEAKAYEQGQIDRIHVTFAGHVSRGRGVSSEHVNTQFGQGRMMLAQQAIAVRAADRIGTLPEVIRSATTRSATAHSTSLMPTASAPRRPGSLPSHVETVLRVLDLDDLDQREKVAAQVAEVKRIAGEATRIEWEEEYRLATAPKPISPERMEAILQRGRDASSPNGPPPKSQAKVIQEEATSHHEAGHGAAALSHGVRVIRLEIYESYESEKWLGMAFHESYGQRLHDEMVMIAAGPAAWSMFTGRESTFARGQGGKGSDYDHICTLLNQWGKKNPGASQRAKLQHVKECAGALVWKYKKAIEAIAAELHRRRKLPGDEVKAIFDKNRP